MVRRVMQWKTPEALQPHGKGKPRALEPTHRLDAGVDPYYVWALGARFASFGTVPPPRSPKGKGVVYASCVIEIDVQKAASVEGEDTWWERLHADCKAWVTTAFLGLPHGRDGKLLASHYVTGLIPINRYGDLLRHPMVRRVLLSLPRGAWPEKLRLPQRAHRALPAPLAGVPTKAEPAPLVIAVIDDGCPFLHAQFRRSGGTRIACLWDQDVGHDAAGGPWKAVANFGYGRQLNRGAINTLLAKLDSEEDGYKALRYPAEPGIARDQAPSRARPMPRATHGSHVTSLAAGCPDPMPGGFADAASAADLIFVQLPSETVHDTSGGSLQTYVLDALRYVIDSTHPAAKLVINISYGAAAGPHDGTSVLDAAITQMLDQRDDLAIVVAAGNLYPGLVGDTAGGPERRLHAEVHLAAGATQELAWQLPFDGTDDHFLELWPRGPDANHAAAPLDVMLRPPSATADGCPLVSPARAMFLCFDDSEQPSAAVISQQCAPNSGAGATPAGRPLVLIAVAGAQAGAERAAPAGRWTVQLRNPANLPLTVHAWIERCDGTFGGGGRQSHFSLDEAACTGRQTLGSLANGAGPVVVGGTVRASGQVAEYSSSGPSLWPSTRQRPTVSAPCEESASQAGLLVPACFSGDWVRANGSSVAAPIVARRLANAMAGSERPLNRAGIAALTQTIGTAWGTDGDQRQGTRRV